MTVRTVQYIHTLTDGATATCYEGSLPLEYSLGTELPTESYLTNNEQYPPLSTTHTTLEPPTPYYFQWRYPW